MTLPLDVHYRSRARSDIDEIFWYIASGNGPKTALAYVQRPHARCRNIGDVPQSGRPRFDLSPGLRSITFEKSLVICYLIEDERVWITNIFARGRDVEAAFRAKPSDN